MGGKLLPPPVAGKRGKNNTVAGLRVNVMPWTSLDVDAV